MQTHNQPTQWVESPFIRSLLAGAIAGTTVDLSLYPIDTLKTRLQSSAGFQAAGGFSGIYKGVGSAFVGSAPGAALFFVVYDSTKRSLLSSRHGELEQVLRIQDGRNTSWLSSEPVAHMVAASLGEVAACSVRVPTEVIKQRAQALQHPSSLAALQHILRQRRTSGISTVWQELYRGWSITIMREVPFTVIQFPLWEAMKRWYKRRKTGEGTVSPRVVQEIPVLESAAFGSVSGAVAAAITTPLDVLKTRMMLSRERQGMVPLLRDIMRQHGARAFVAGLGPRVMWISAGGAIFLGSYQWAINKLGGEV